MQTKAEKRINLITSTQFESDRKKLFCFKMDELRIILGESSIISSHAMHQLKSDPGRTAITAVIVTKRKDFRYILKFVKLSEV
jgi:hypothetical protein